MDPLSRDYERRPRKRPPLRSYIPFAIVVAVCLAIIGGVLWLLASVAQDLTGSNHVAGRPAPTAHSTLHRSIVPAGSGAHATTHHLVTTPASGVGKQAASATPVRSLMGGSVSEVQITPGGPLPTSTPAPTATAIGDAGLAVAREVDLTGKPLEASTRFLSPALRFYAVVTLHNVHSTDQLHFLFQKDGVNLPSDDIQYQAGTDADVQSFSAWADYKGGTRAFPKGRYRVLFYRNGVLEAVRKFSVGLP